MRISSELDVLVATYPSLLVGYSGGVDSTLLAVVARNVLGRERAIAAIGISSSLPAVQRCQAGEIARRFDLRLLEIETEELSDPQYAANPTNRCYFCKRELWTKLTELARQRRIAVIADGTNADDLGEHRPGIRAATQFGIRSPLAEVGYTKERVRAEALALGIPIWYAPAAPCLSSRVVYGLAVTPDRLRQVEDGEGVVRAAGVTGNLRVRHRGGEARIEVDPGDLDTVLAHRDRIGTELLALGFDRVTLDLDGYRRGSLLQAGEATLELIAERS